MLFTFALLNALSVANITVGLRNCYHTIRISLMNSSLKHYSLFSEKNWLGWFLKFLKTGLPLFSINIFKTKLLDTAFLFVMNLEIVFL